MSSQVTNYKCPACTGPLHFVGTSGKVECEYCGSSYTIEEIEAHYAKEDAAAAAATAEAEAKAKTDTEENGSAEGGSWDFGDVNNDWGEDSDTMRAYSCPSCGAELICDETTAATSCPYCDNPAIIPGQFGGTLKPDYVIPFKVTKEEAIAALKKYYKGKKFLPKEFSAKNHIEDIKGVYVPFWLFDGKVSGSMDFDCTRVETYSTATEKVTVTKHYNEYRSGYVSFEKIPADASSKMPDEHMDSIEPFDYKEMKEFSTAYLPGFLADKYDVSMEESASRADNRAKNSMRDEMKADAGRGYASCIPRGENITLEQGKVSYALLPVWMLTTKWNDERFLFAMNGQTGKFIGDLPVAKSKVFGWFAKIALPLAAVLAVVMIAL